MNEDQAERLIKALEQMNVNLVYVARQIEKGFEEVHLDMQEPDEEEEEEVKTFG